MWVFFSDCYFVACGFAVFVSVGSFCVVDVLCSVFCFFACDSFLWYWYCFVFEWRFVSLLYTIIIVYFICFWGWWLGGGLIWGFWFVKVVKFSVFVREFVCLNVG